MDSQKQLMLWVAGFTGVGLMYAAYKDNINPIKLFGSKITGKTSIVGTVTGKAPVGSTPKPPAPILANPIFGGTAVDNKDVARYGDSQQYYLFDQYGNPLRPVEQPYQTTIATYIPPRKV